jgi:hypothetical protein
MGGGDRNAKEGRNKKRNRPPVSAQNPCIGVSLVMRSPMVRTMRQPPSRVPNPMAAWHASTTQNGTKKSPPRRPCE